MRALEVFDGRTNSRLELNNRRAIIRRFIVDDNVELHALIFDDAFDGREGDVYRIGVEVLELAHALEVLDVLARYLGDFEQANLTLVLDDRTTLDVRLSLVRQLHEKLGLRLDKVVKDPEVHIGAQVVDIGHKDELLARTDELV